MTAVKTTGGSKAAKVAKTSKLVPPREKAPPAAPPRPLSGLEVVARNSSNAGQAIASAARAEIPALKVALRPVAPKPALRPAAPRVADVANGPARLADIGLKASTLPLTKKMLDFEPIDVKKIQKPRDLWRFFDKVQLLTFVKGFDEAYQKLSSQDKKRYDSIVASLGNDALGRRALANLLVNGTLMHKDMKGEGGKTLLEHLETLATGSVHESVNRQKVLGDVIRDIYTPDHIGQGFYKTCVPAAAQRMLAEQSPAEYARLMAGFASVSGEVDLPNGQKARRPEDWNWLAVDKYPNGDGRTSSERLFQTSLMNYAISSSGNTYNAADDTRTGPVVDGLTEQEALNLFEAVLKKDYDAEAVSSPRDGAREAAVLALIKNATAKNVLVPVVLWYPNQSGLDPYSRKHMVLVSHVDAEGVHFFNPTTETMETLSEADFKKRIHQAMVPRPRVLKVILARTDVVRLNAVKADLADDPFDRTTGGKPVKVKLAVAAAQSLVGTVAGKAKQPDPKAKQPDPKAAGKGLAAGVKGLLGFGFKDFINKLMFIGFIRPHGIGDDGTTSAESTAGGSSNTGGATQRGRNGRTYWVYG